MKKTKRASAKKSDAVAKIARKTVGLMLRVGDAAEALAVAASARTSPPPSVPREESAPTASSEESPPREDAPVLENELPTPSSEPVTEPAPIVEVRVAAVEPVAPAPAPPALSPVPAVPVPVPVVAIDQDALDNERASAAIDAYVTLHNLRPEFMPSRDLLVASLKSGMAEHGATFSDAHARALLDAQMRIHFRSLGARSGLGTGPTTR
jgi:hypothetical protein